MIQIPKPRNFQKWLREEALLMNSLTNSGLKPFCTEISLKHGGNRTSDYLDICLNIFSKWLVRIWLTFLLWKQMRLTPSGHHGLWDPMQLQADISVILTLVTDLNHAWSQGKSNFYLGFLSVVLGSVKRESTRSLSNCQTDKNLVPRLFTSYCKLLYNCFKHLLQKTSFLATPSVENKCWTLYETLKVLV